MKKISLICICIIIALSLVGIGVGCKSETTKTETSATTTAVETTVVETTAAETEAQPVELTFWWWGESTSAGMEDLIDKAISEYQKIHPNVTINAVLQGTDEVIPAFLAAAEAGEGPDIATLWYGLYMYEQIWKGYGVPISDYISSDETDHWLEKGFMGYDGKIWGANCHIGQMIMDYNKDLFIQAGLDAENPPTKTWDDFLNTCETLKKAGITPYGLSAADGWQVLELPSFWSYQLASIADLKAAVTGEKSFADASFTDVFARFKELMDKGYLNADITSLNAFDRRLNMWQGKYAMSQEGGTNEMLQANKDQGTEKFQVLPIPQIGDKAVDYVATTGVSNFITSWSKNKEIAADFLASFHSPEIQQFIYDRFEGRVMPFDDRFDFSQVSDPSRISLYDKTKNSYKNGIYQFDYYVPWTILEAYMTQGQLLFSGKDVSVNDIGAAIEKAAATWREQNPEMLDAYKKW
ncbi:MAG: ABC transporter substrate-binding protein [Candidatus Humimicrobiaceae bacterium]